MMAEWLKAGGYQGAENDMAVSFFKDNGAISSVRNDAEKQFLLSKGVAPGQLNDMWFRYLGSLGYLGALNDRSNKYYNTPISTAIHDAFSSGVLPTAYAGFTRGGDATYTNSAGLIAISSGPPRITYDPATLACLGMLVEGQAVNVQSSQWSLWIRDGDATAGVLTENYGVAPDGTTTAARVVLDKTSNTYSRVQRPLTGQTAGIYTTELWMKCTSAASANVGLRIGSIGVNCAVTNQWQKFSVNRPDTTTTPDTQIILYDLIAGNDETADILVWGPQTAVGVSSYIPNPTNGTAVRPADPIVLSGSAFTDRFGDGSDWVMALEFTCVGALTGLVFEIGGASDRLSSTGAVHLHSGGNLYFYGPGATTQAAVAVSHVAGTRIRVALGYSANKMRVSVNGGAVTTDASGTVTGPLGRFAIGRQIDTAGQVQNLIVHDAEFKPGQGSTMSDAALQALSAL